MCKTQRGNVRSEWKTRPHPCTSHDYVSCSPSAPLATIYLHGRHSRHSAAILQFSTSPHLYHPFLPPLLLLLITCKAEEDFGSRRMKVGGTKTNPEAHWFLAHRISKTMRDSSSSIRLWGCLDVHTQHSLTLQEEEEEAEEMLFDTTTHNNMVWLPDDSWATRIIKKLTAVVVVGSNRLDFDAVISFRNCFFHLKSFFFFFFWISVNIKRPFCFFSLHLLFTLLVDVPAFSNVFCQFPPLFFPNLFFLPFSLLFLYFFFFL